MQSETMCKQLQRWNLIGLLLLLLALNILGTADCSICETCICFGTDSDRMVNCRGKRLDGGSVLNFDVLLFDQEAHMTDLNLSENEMSVLPTDIFRDLRDLKMLNMSDNKLQDIPPEAFDHLESLTGLDLSQNVLSSLPAALLSEIKSLEYLNARNNQLKELDPAIQCLTNLTWLDVSRNNIESLENGSFATLAELKHLDLSFNRIAHLGTDNLAHLTKLVTLNIDNNHLVHLLPYEVPVSVSNLNAGHNAIAEIPETLINLRILNVEYNKISELDGNSSVFAKLESFNISGNELTDFPDIVLESLETLDLSFNRLTAVPESLNAENLPVLKTLVISGNPIRELKFNSELNLELLVAQSLDLLENIEGGAFDKLGTLESDGCLNLTISKNKRLEKIHVKAFEDVNMCALDLSSNNLTSVYPSLTKSSNALGANYSVNLQDNPFHCDCSLQWILVDLIPRLYEVYPELLEDLRCASPLDIKDMRMVHWYKWKEQVFCKDSQVLVPKSVQASEVTSGGGGTIKIESSTEMLAVLIGAAVGLSMLVIIGLVLARRIAVQRSRRNRRF